MLSNYNSLLEKIDNIKEALDRCVKKLDEIKPDEREKYENPQYRMWSGNIRNIEEFTNRLEEWLEKPRVAEAKRYLSDLKEWAELQKEVSLEEIEKDWRFLSKNVDEIKYIHKQIKNISYESIKKKTANWVLNRIFEKDIEKAKIWATNANKFCSDLKQLEDKEVEYNLAEEVKKDAIDELLKITSFDKDRTNEITRYNNLIDKANEVIKSLPEEITEEAVTETYKIKGKNENEEVEKCLNIINKIIEEIKTKLINVEWVIEFTDSRDYSEIWKGKQNAMKKKDLEAISKALDEVIQKASSWKESKRKEIDNVLSKIERMAKSIENEKLKREFEELNKQARSIDWDKPDVRILFKIIFQADTLREELRKELVQKLQNKDAISIIEEPEIVNDLGKSKGLDFNRFFEALRIVLKRGLIEIKVVGRKNNGERGGQVP
ncbi:hypothetical protein DRO38_01355 [Candidatus Bathyarchaeota archaeon]|nr:MAG: hypothetical protein DRO38_01355 [Candidatus Bathyarchaeota archaeon]